MASRPESLTADETALLERVADRVVALHLELPAILTLETARPLSVIAGQALYFFEPIVTTLLDVPGYRRFAGVVERREGVAALARLIEERAEAAQRERRAARRRARDATPPSETGPPSGGEA